MSSIIKISDELHKKLAEMKRELSVIKHKDLSFNDLILEITQMAQEYYQISPNKIKISPKIKNILENSKKRVKAKDKEWFRKLQNFYKNVSKDEAIEDIDKLSHDLRWI